MPAVSLSIDDLTPFAPEINGPKAEAMITDAMALAGRVAPCVKDEELDEDDAAAAKAIIRGAILRWNEAGTGAVQSETVGPFSHTLDNSQPRRRLLWPSEIQDLQEICRGDEQPVRVFGIDTLPAYGLAGHSPICALAFGARYCSCGADLTDGQYPLYEDVIP